MTLNDGSKAMTVADLRALLNNTPTVYDDFTVVLDINGETLTGWSVEPKESAAGIIGDTYDNTLFLY